VSKQLLTPQVRLVALEVDPEDPYFLHPIDWDAIPDSEPNEPEVEPIASWPESLS
jgi:hypothetical protein